MVVRIPAAITDSHTLTMIAHFASLCGASDDIFVVSFPFPECCKGVIWVPNTFPSNTLFAITWFTNILPFGWMLASGNSIRRRDSRPATMVPGLVLHSMGDLVLAEEADATSTRMEVVLPHK